VAELERQLGVVLLERTGRRLVPTRVALSIAEHARAMAGSAEAIGRTLTGQTRQLAAAVRITASQTVAVYMPPPLVAKLREQEPTIAITVVASNAISNLLRLDAGIAIRMARLDQSSLIARRIGQVEVGAYA
jgi:DNA-binding transcriptional LysR family regulator